MSLLAKKDFFPLADRKTRVRKLISIFFFPYSSTENELFITIKVKTKNKKNLEL